MTTNDNIHNSKSKGTLLWTSRCKLGIKNCSFQILVSNGMESVKKNLNDATKALYSKLPKKKLKAALPLIKNTF